MKMNIFIIEEKLSTDDFFKQLNASKKQHNFFFNDYVKICK